MTDNSTTLLYKKTTDLTEISVSSLDKLFEIANQREITKGQIILKQAQICKTITLLSPFKELKDAIPFERTATSQNLS